VQEEGIILKNPQSQWKPDDRSLGAWLKLKPEYTNAHEVRLHAACRVHEAWPCCM